MILFNIEILDSCVRKHAQALKAMNVFVNTLESHNINNHNELLQLFPKADYVGNNRYVFDIKGNNYRVICIIVFIAGTVQFRFAGTHAEYDRINAKTI